MMALAHGSRPAGWQGLNRSGWCSRRLRPSLTTLRSSAPSRHALRHREQELQQRLSEEEQVLNRVGRGLGRFVVGLVSEQTDVVGPILHRARKHTSRRQRVGPRTERAAKVRVTRLQGQLYSTSVPHRGKIRCGARVRVSRLNEYARDFGWNVVRSGARLGRWKKNTIVIKIAIKCCGRLCGAIVKYLVACNKTRHYDRRKATVSTAQKQRGTFIGRPAITHTVQSYPHVAVRTICSEHRHV